MSIHLESVQLALLDMLAPTMLESFRSSVSMFSQLGLHRSKASWVCAAQRGELQTRRDEMKSKRHDRDTRRHVTSSA